MSQIRTVPVVVSDLVPQVAENRAIGLLQGLAVVLTVVVVGLCHVDGDEPVGVTCENVLTR